MLDCCQGLQEFLANADYCADADKGGVFYNPGRTGSVVLFIYCPFCGKEIVRKGVPGDE